MTFFNLFRLKGFEIFLNSILNFSDTPVESNLLIVDVTSFFGCLFSIEEAEGFAIHVKALFNLNVLTYFWA